MLDELDDGARTGVWVALGVVAFVIFGLIGGLAVRQLGGHGAMKPALAAGPMAGATAGATASTGTAPADDVDALLDIPLAGDLAGTVFFATGSSTVDAEARAVLETIRAAAEAAPGKRLVVSGFHDASGGAVLNHELAKLRAMVVRDELAALGVERTRMVLRKPESTVGGGPDDPQGRRVEVRLVD
jgi:outer membrane protein OmpA-like peptidoglycan-associated protein